ncbi:MAG: hypothetical protein ACFB50_18025 [Rubrobacteraceae bacterium]
MNARRVLDVVAALSVGDGALWVLAPRRRGLLWLVGPGPVKRFVELVAEERPWLARLLGGAQVVFGIWLALRQYPEP